MKSSRNGEIIRQNTSWLIVASGNRKAVISACLCIALISSRVDRNVLKKFLKFKANNKFFGEIFSFSG